LDNLLKLYPLLVFLVYLSVQEVAKLLQDFLKEKSYIVILQMQIFILYTGFLIDLITVILLVGLIYFVSDLISVNFLKDITLSDEIMLYSFFAFLRGSLLGYLQAKEMFKKLSEVLG
jgi:hypothetical protein